MYRLPSGARIFAGTFLLAFCLLAGAPGHSWAEGFVLDDIETTPGNTYFDIYDYSLPGLISVVLLDKGDTPAEMLHRTVSYVNFHSTPGLYERYAGLGTGAAWDRNASVMLCSGNLYCSEQSSLASMILEPYFPEKAVHDTHNHTFHDVLMTGRWVIVDPMFDMRILNGLGLPATFMDVEIYLAGDDGALDLPEEPLPRTLDYLANFEKKIFKSERHAYGGRMELPPAGFGLFLDQDVHDFKRTLSEKGMPLSGEFNPIYLLYMRNQIYALAAGSDDPASKAAEIQDFFFERIRSESGEELAPELAGSDLYRARNMQLLGRFDEALAIYKELEQTEAVRLFQAQVHCLRGDERAFDALASGLDHNPFYRHMHYLLHGAFMRPDDAEFFRTFGFRWITKPPALDRSPFDLTR